MHLFNSLIYLIDRFFNRLSCVLLSHDITVNIIDKIISALGLLKPTPSRFEIRRVKGRYYHNGAVAK